MHIHHPFPSPRITIYMGIGQYLGSQLALDNDMKAYSKLGTIFYRSLQTVWDILVHVRYCSQSIRTKACQPANPAAHNTRQFLSNPNMLCVSFSFHFFLFGQRSQRKRVLYAFSLSLVKFLIVPNLYQIYINLLDRYVSFLCLYLAIMQCILSLSRTFVDYCTCFHFRFDQRNVIFFCLNV